MTQPSLSAVAESMTVVAIPMRVRFRGVEVREGAIIEGPCGSAEFAPFVEYGPRESSRWLASAIEAAWSGWPEPLRSSVPVNATIPAVRPAAVPAVLRRFPAARTFKIKVAERGESPEDDVCRVAAVRDVVGPTARLRVDANGGWDLDTALSTIRRLAAYDVEYAEQPCASVAELKELRKRLARSGIEVPVAADESIRKADDPMLVAREEAADLIVIKAAPLGGVRQALRVVEQVGLPAVVSSALETSVGMAAGVALAAALPELDYACGLGTVALLEGDVAREPMVAVDGHLAPRRVGADPDLLRHYAASPERQQWWRERLESAWQFL